MFLFTGLIVLTDIGLIGQNAINTDRPEQSDDSHSVENNIQIETGARFSKLDEVTNSFDNVTLIRDGVSRKFEIRLLNQYTVISDDTKVSGIQPLTVSFKNQLCNQHGILPKLTLVSYFRLPVTLSQNFKADHFGYTFTLAARHQLSSKLKLYSNFGVTQDQQTTDMGYLGAVELNYNVTEKFSAFTEYYGNYAASTNASNGIDIGFIYTVKNNFAVDMALGSPTLKLAVNKFIAFGMSVRLPK